MAILKPKPAPKVLDISSLLGKCKNRISRIGIEIEGGWKTLPKGIALEHDGSVFRGNRSVDISYGEIPLGPMIPGNYAAAIRKYYPHVVDATCGLHVHMSFEHLRIYSILMAEEYQDTMVAYLTRWADDEGISGEHTFRDRLKGRSRFCQKMFWPDLQTNASKDYNQDRMGHRYTMINYCHQSHGTLECRLLPMFADVEQSVRGVKRVLEITNACLVKLGKGREKLVSELDDSLKAHHEKVEITL